MRRTDKSPWGKDVLVGNIKEWIEYYQPLQGFRQDGYTYISGEIKGMRNRMMWKRSGRCKPRDILGIEVVIHQYYEDYREIIPENVTSVKILWENPYECTYFEGKDNLVNSEEIPIVIDR